MIDYSPHESRLRDRYMAGEFFEPNKTRLHEAIAAVGLAGRPLLTTGDMFDATVARFEDDITGDDLSRAGALELYGEVNIKRRISLAAGLVTFPEDRPLQVNPNNAYADLGALCATGLVTVGHEVSGLAPFGTPRLSLWYDLYDSGHVLVDGEYRSLRSPLLPRQADLLWRALVLDQAFDVPPATDELVAIGGMLNSIPVGPDQVAAFTTMVQKVAGGENPLSLANPSV